MPSNHKIRTPCAAIPLSVEAETNIRLFTTEDTVRVYQRGILSVAGINLARIQSGNSNVDWLICEQALGEEVGAHENEGPQNQGAFPETETLPETSVLPWEFGLEDIGTLDWDSLDSGAPSTPNSESDD